MVNFSGNNDILTKPQSYGQNQVQEAKPEPVKEEVKPETKDVATAGSSSQLDRIENNSKTAKTAGIVAGATGIAALAASGIALHKVNGITKEAKELMPKIKGIVDTVSDVNDKLKIKEFAQRIAPVVTSVESAVSDIAGKVKPEIKNVNEYVDRILGTLKDDAKLKDFVAQLTDKYSVFGDKLLETFGRISEKVSPELDKADQHVDRFINILKDDEKCKAFVRLLMNKTSGVRENVLALLDETLGKTGDMKGKMGEVLDGVIDSLKGILGRKKGEPIAKPVATVSADGIA